MFIRRKLNKLGYKIEYFNDTDFRKLVGCIPALSALRLEDVDLDIDEKIPALADILPHRSIWKLIDGLKISDHKDRQKLTEYDSYDD